MSAAKVESEPDFYVTGGSVQRDAPCYVVRRADAELHEGLSSGNFCFVLTPRQMGKSSLMVHTASRLCVEGFGVATIDLTAIGQNLTAEQWYAGMLSQIGRRLDLEDELMEFWDSHPRLGPLQRWIQAIRYVVLPRYPGPLVIFIDEIDAVRSLPFPTDEFFAGIRELFNGRTEDSELKRLTFCLLGVATPSDLIRDTRTTPFNIGRRIELHDFTETEAAPLARGLRCENSLGVELLKRILYWTGGHPYLTQKLCQAVALANLQSAIRNPQFVDRICTEMFFTRSARDQESNLTFVREQLLRSEADLAGLLSLYAQLRCGKRVIDDETNPLVSVLRLSGIVRTEDGYLRLRNRIYARAFDHEWVKANMPDAELRRQKAAFRRGLFQAAAGAAVIIAIMATLAIFAIKQRNAAERAQAEALSRELSMNALARLPLDPELSVLLATEAVRIAPTTQAEDALRQSLPESYLQTVMRGHTKAVRSVAFSQDGARAVTAGLDGVARIWETSSGRIVAELRGHSRDVQTAEFSPDGGLVVTAAADRTARVWEAASGQCLVQLLGHERQVNGASFSPDGKLVVTSSDDRTARVWDTTTGRELIVLRGHSGDVWNAAFSPDGKRILTASNDATARVWETRTGRLAVKLSGHRGEVGAVFSPDGQRIATWGVDKTARIWEARGGRMIFVLRGHTRELRSGAFSPDSKLLVTSSYDGTAGIWDAGSGRNLVKLIGHASKVLNARFSPNGKLVVTSSYDGSAHIWDVTSGKSLKELRGHTGQLDCAAIFSPDGKLVLTGSNDGTARIWVINRSDLATELIGHTNQLLGVAFSPNGRYVVTASNDGAPRLWDARSGQIIHELRGHTKTYVRSADFSPDGRSILTASADQTARLWDLVSGRQIKEFRGHTNSVLDAHFSPDGRRLVTASRDGTARVWDVQTGLTLLELKGHSNSVWSARYNPDGNLIVTGGQDQTARLWDSRSGRCFAILSGHTGEIFSAAFSPDGKLIATASSDATARIWDVAAGGFLLELRGHTANVSSVAFSPDGQYLVTASSDGAARVWEAAAGRSIVQIRGHTDELSGAAFSPDGRYVVTSSFDKTARIYDCEHCGPLSKVIELARRRLTRGLTPEERTNYLHEAAGK